MQRFPIAPLVLLLLVGFVLGCQAEDGSESPADDSQPSATEIEYTALEDANHQEIQTAIQDNGARLTIVNMWATWCAPCIEEFPYFIEVDERYKDQGVDVVFVSTDFEEQKPQAEAFLKDQGWTGTSFFKTSRDNDFINAFSTKWSGALPATFIYDGSGTLVDFWEGDIKRQELLDRVAALLDDQAAS